MKRLEYKTVKWEKMASMLIEDKEEDFNELDLLEMEYLNGDIDEVRYHLVRSSCYESIAENYFIEGDFSSFKENVKYSLNEFLMTLKLLEEGKSAFEATKNSINEDLEDGYLGYLALIIADYDMIPKVTLPGSSLIRMLSGKEIEEETDDFINTMERAIVLRDSEMFETALANRIKEIRKVPTDDYECLDWWSIALVQEAEKAGMQFYSDYIEVDIKERKNIPVVADVAHKKQDKAITQIVKTNKKEMESMSEEKLLEFIKSCSEKMEEIMQDEEDVNLCEKVFIKNMEAYEQLLTIDFDKYAEDAANEYCMFADFYSQWKPSIRKAVKASTRKLELCQKRAEKDKSLMDEVAYSYIELGEIYENDDRERKAEKMYREAEKINPKKFKRN